MKWILFLYIFTGTWDSPTASVTVTTATFESYEACSDAVDQLKVIHRGSKVAAVATCLPTQK